MGRMDVAYEIVRWLHLLGGAVGLLLVPGPLLTKKGGALHKRIGKLFVLAMTTAGASGLVMALLWLAFPRTFQPAGSDGEVAAIRASGMFLATIGLLTLCAIRQLVRAPVRKREPRAAPSMLDLALPIASAGFGAVTIVSALASGRGLFLVFGGIALFSAIEDLRFVTRPLPSRMGWWYQHMRGAMVAVIAALTAFLVFGGRRWLADLVPVDARWVFWIAPTLVIVPATEIWVARYKRRFGERKA